MKSKSKKDIRTHLMSSVKLTHPDIGTVEVKPKIFQMVVLFAL